MAALSTIATLGMLALGTAQTIASAKGKKPEMPTVPTPDLPKPSPDLPEDQRRRIAAIALRRQRAALSSGGASTGRAGTILTGPMGLDSAPSVERKTLLGY